MSRYSLPRRARRMCSAPLQHASGRAQDLPVAQVVEIFDTAGRQEIDEHADSELKELKEFLNPQETCWWLTRPPANRRSALQPISTTRYQITGIILTKLDGDARGGAALSMREVTRRPIKFAGNRRKTGSV